MALLKQIWLKSTAFFRALDDIKGLQGLVSDASLNLQGLRGSLRNADEGLVMSAMRIPQLFRRRKNEKALCALLGHMQGVLNGKKAMEELIAMEDYVGALDVVSATSRIYKEHLLEVEILKDIGQQLDGTSIIALSIYHCSLYHCSLYLSFFFSFFVSFFLSFFLFFVCLFVSFFSFFVSFFLSFFLSFFSFFLFFLSFLSYYVLCSRLSLFLYLSFCT